MVGLAQPDTLEAPLLGMGEYICIQRPLFAVDQKWEGEKIYIYISLKILRQRSRIGE